MLGAISTVEKKKAMSNLEEKPQFFDLRNQLQRNDEKQQPVGTKHFNLISTCFWSILSILYPNIIVMIKVHFISRYQDEYDIWSKSKRFG